MRRSLSAALCLSLFIILGTPSAAQDAQTPQTPQTPQASQAPAAATEVVVRQSLDPATGAVIGQHVALRVDVLFRGEMPRPPRVSLPDVASLQALRFETQGTTMRETIAGESYVGQRFEFALYARRGGTFDIPPASVTLLDAEGDVTGTAQGEAVSLEVSVPPGVDPSQPVIATSQFTLNEQWEPDPQGAFKAGDAIVRTITRSARDVSGLAMLDLPFSAPDGVRVYADPPGLTDHTDRGVVTGQRVDRVTYVFERGGHVVLPAASQPWWNLATSTLETADAAGITIDVAAAPANGAAGTSGRATAGGFSLATIATAFLLGLLLLGAALLLLRHRSRVAAATEPKAFTALRHACSGTDAGAIYRAFSDWRALLPPAEKRRASQAAVPLDAALFAGAAPEWSAAASRDLLDHLAPVRRSSPAGGGAGDLPPLNP